MENNFIWTDDKVMEFAIKWLNDRVAWAVMHDFAAMPAPIQVELGEFKKKHTPKKNWIVYQIHDKGGIRRADPNDSAYLLNNSSIFSVKRLSDGTIFRKGDLMHYAFEQSFRSDGTDLAIDYFTIKNDEIYIHQHDASGEDVRIANWVKTSK